MNDTYIVMQEFPNSKMRIAEGNGSGTHNLQDALTLIASLRFNSPTTQFFVVRVVVVEDETISCPYRHMAYGHAAYCSDRKKVAVTR